MRRPQDLGDLLDARRADDLARDDPADRVVGTAGPAGGGRSSSSEDLAQPGRRTACSPVRGPGRSPHSRGVGKTLPGLAMPSGSKAQRTSCMVSRSSGVNCLAILWRFSWPTPCSPVIEPPEAMHSSRIDAGELLGVVGLALDRVVEQHERVQVAVAGVEDVGDAQPDLVGHRRSSRRRTSGSWVRGMTPSCTKYDGLMRPTAAKADLRPFHISARSAGFGGDAGLEGAVPALAICSTCANCASTSTAGPSSSMTSTATAPARVAAGDGLLGRLDRERVHHLDGGRDDARGDDVADRRRGVLDAAEADEHRLHRLGDADEPQRQLGGDAERPLAADERAEQVVAGVLRRRPAEVHDARRRAARPRRP